MMNYTIWECPDTTMKLVEVFDENDLHSVQKELVDKGYVIIETFKPLSRSVFIKIIDAKEYATW